MGRNAPGAAGGVPGAAGAAAGVEGAAAGADGADLPGAGGVGGVCALTAVRVKALRLAKANTESLK